MKITVTRGSGSGLTPLAAFDDALRDAGISDFNLIQLSSVIPYNAEIVVERYVPSALDLGCRLYVVLARKEATLPGSVAWAGLAWAQSSVTGLGVFAEFGALAESDLVSYLENSLQSMSRNRNDLGRWGLETKSAQCVDHPVSSIVAAVYAVDTW